MKTVISLLFVWICALSVFGQSSRISVRITASGDAPVAANVKNYLSKMLSSLKDVDVVDGASDFSIAAVVGETRLNSGELTGYSVAANFIQIVKCDGKVYLDLQDSLVLTTGSKGLEEVSKSIVAQFDSEVLSDFRKKK